MYIWSIYYDCKLYNLCNMSEYFSLITIEDKFEIGKHSSFQLWGLFSTA